MRTFQITVHDPEEERALLEYLNRLHSTQVRDLTAEQEQQEWEEIPAHVRAKIERGLAQRGQGIPWEEFKRQNPRFFRT